MIGQQIKHFRVLERVGEQGKGIVYRVLDTHVDVVRALKLIHPILVQDLDFMRRLDREAPRLEQLVHPNIQTFIAFYNALPRPFIVTEYVEGTTLGALIRNEGPLDQEQVLPLFKQLVRGLSFAHRQDIIHRDLNPFNILVTSKGQVKIADFGLAKEWGGSDLAVSKGEYNTLHYLSPEHVRSIAEVDHRSDLYAVGMALYEAFTGRTPFQEEEKAYIVMRAIVEETVTPPDQFMPGIPQEWSDVVMKALAKDPDDRYQSAEEMLAALKACEAQLPVHPPEAPAEAPTDEPLGEIAEAPPLAPAPSRGGRSWGTYSILAFALVVTTVLTWWVLEDTINTPTSPFGVSFGEVRNVVIRPGITERILPSAGSAEGRQGRLVLKAVPYGNIAVGDSTMGQDSVDVAVRAGTRRVFFTHPTYGTKQMVVALGRGQRKEVTCYFEGYIRVQTKNEDGFPLQADLFINEEGTGRKTPIEKPYPLAPGLYMIEAFLENHVGGVTYLEVLPASDDSILTKPPIETLEFALRNVAR